MRLSQFAKGRDNNFNLIRVTAALSVLLSHAFVLSTGSPAAEPFRQQLGMTAGSVAVDIFFVTSGFLVTGSLFAKKDVRAFLLARLLRVFPALFVVVGSSALILGPLLTTLSLEAYFRDIALYRYLLKCSTLFFGVEYNLPGVFQWNPYKYAVNGSLWTMPHELRLYVILAALWLSLRLTAARREKIFVVVASLFALFAGLALLGNLIWPFYGGTFLRLFYFFFLGATFSSQREHIPLFPLAGLYLGAALVIAMFLNGAAFQGLYLVTVPYLIMLAAYLPNGAIRLYNRLGDYSYGIYLLAFPVQQTIVSLSHGVKPWELTALSLPPTIILAALSWHLVERRALAMKTRAMPGGPSGINRMSQV